MDTVRTVVGDARALLEREYGERLAGVILYGSQARGARLRSRTESLSVAAPTFDGRPGAVPHPSH